MEELSLEAQELRAQRDLGKLRKKTGEEAERDRQEKLLREREQRRADERVRLEQERQEREQEEAERVRREAEQRRKWQDGWLRQTFGSLPKDCPPEHHARICREVQEALEALDPTVADAIVRDPVDVAVEQALAPWRRKKAIHDAITAGEACLPIWARSLDFGFSVPTPTEWQLKIRRLAKAKIAALGEDADMEEIRAAGAEAGQAVAREYAAIEAADRRQREATEARESDRRTREWKLQRGLRHIDSYLRELEEAGEIEFDSAESLFQLAEDRERLTRKLTKRIRPALLKEIEDDPDLDDEDVEEAVEVLVDEALPDFVEEE